jgi:hypothetical protein
MSLAEIREKFKRMEEEIYKEVCRVGCEVYKEMLERIDEQLNNARDKEEYRNKGKRKTTIKTIMGEVEYYRSIYQTKEKKYIFLLDELIGFDGCGLISGLLSEKIAEMICKTSYRGTSEAIGTMTGQSISATGVWNVVQAMGERIDDIEIANANAAKNNEGKGDVEVKVLLEEQDGVYLKLQGADRKLHGESAEMKVAIAYAGWKNTGKNRYELSTKVAAANFETIEKFCRRKEGVIAATFNVDEIELRILNGDGAEWIKRSITDDSVKYQLDVFHRNKAIREYVSDAEMREQIFEFLYSKEIDKLLEYIEALTNSVEDEKQKENLGKLLRYFTNNKTALVSYKDRGIELPEAPEGLEYHNLGTMESNIFTIIGNRMKGRRACWSINGGNNLARLLTLKASRKLNETISNLTSAILGEKYSYEIQTPLTAAKSPSTIGSGYNGYTSAPIPQLEWGKKIFGLKTFSELKF